MSTQQLAIVELAVRTRLFLESVDSYLEREAAGRGLVNKRRRQLIPALVQRQALSDALARYMAQLGLRRAEPRLPTPLEYAAEFDRRNAEEAARRAVGSTG